MGDEGLFIYLFIFLSEGKADCPFRPTPPIIMVSIVVRGVEGGNESGGGRLERGVEGGEVKVAIYPSGWEMQCRGGD